MSSACAATKSIETSKVLILFSEWGVKHVNDEIRGSANARKKNKKFTKKVGMCENKKCEKRSSV